MRLLWRVRRQSRRDSGMDWVEEDRASCAGWGYPKDPVELEFVLAFVGCGRVCLRTRCWRDGGSGCWGCSGKVTGAAERVKESVSESPSSCAGCYGGGLWFGVASTHTMLNRLTFQGCKGCIARRSRLLCGSVPSPSCSIYSWCSGRFVPEWC